MGGVVLRMRSFDIGLSGKYSVCHRLYIVVDFLLQYWEALFNVWFTAFGSIVLVCNDEVFLYTFCCDYSYDSSTFVGYGIIVIMIY